MDRFTPLAAILEQLPQQLLPLFLPHVVALLFLFFLLLFFLFFTVFCRVCNVLFDVRKYYIIFNIIFIIVLFTVNFFLAIFKNVSFPFRFSEESISSSLDQGRIKKIQKEGAPLPLPPNENFTFQDMQQ